MSAVRAQRDLDDADGLIGADREGLLHGASMAGAQVRALAAAVDEGALEPLGNAAPRALIWVAGRGPAATAAAMLAATLGPVAAEPIVITPTVPPWIGALDVLVIAGDDPADPALVNAAGTGVRRGARVVVGAPFEGPLRDAAAGRVAELSPRLWVPDEFGLSRYLALGPAVAGVFDPAVRLDLAALADALDAETLRNSAGREVFTNPAKLLAQRISNHSVALAGDTAATLALARHGAAALLRIGHRAVAGTTLADAVVALRSGWGGTGRDDVAALFHDEELDGPLPDRPLVLVPTLSGDREVAAARIAGHPDIELLGVGDVPAEGAVAAGAPPAEERRREDTDPPAREPSAPPVPELRAEHQLAVLALRLEMAAVYLRLMEGDAP